MPIGDNKPVNIIKPLSVYVDSGGGSDKQGDVSSGTYKLSSNREAQHTDGGYSGHTGGVLMVSMDIKQIVAVTTTSFGTLHAAILGGGYVRVVIPIENNLVSFVGIIKEASAEWDHTKGSATGSFTFEGGQVQQQSAF